MARLNDTAAIAQKPLSPGSTKSVSVEKIDNGFLVCESTYNPKTQQYKSSKRFQSQAPGVVDSMENSGESGLRDAMDYLGKL